MVDFPKILCVGRRYPNAPARFWAGSINRGPPLIFTVRLEGMINNAAEFAGVNYCYAFTVETGGLLADAWHARSRWIRWPITIPQGKWVSVWVEWDYASDQWQLSLQVRIRRVGLGVTERWWRINLGGGTEWPDAFILSHWKQTAPWNGGGEDFQRVELGTYDNIPPDSCNGVSEV